MKVKVKVANTFIKRANKKNQLFVRTSEGQVLHLSEILKWFPERSKQVEEAFYRGDIEQLSKELAEIFNELLPR